MKFYHASNEIENRFRLTGALSLKKLLEFLPAAILTHLSTFLLLSIDGLTVGNFVGEDALSSVSLFYPVMVVVGSFSVLAASGISTALSLGMGENNRDALRRTKATSLYYMIISAIIVAVIQIPITFGLINHYELTNELRDMVVKYAIGIMIATPFGFISTVGVYQLTVMGRMKTLVWLTALEGGVNVALDILFVGLLKWGVDGAGYATMVANIIRCTVTVIYLFKNTDIYRSEGAKPGLDELKETVWLGFPEFAQSALLGVTGYLMVDIVVDAFGPDGGVIRGVCIFCLSLISVFINGILSSLRPLVGLMSGAKDTEGLRLVVWQSFVLLFIIISAFDAVIIFNPELFYRLHGVDDFPSGGNLSLRIYSLYLLLEAFTSVFRLYFTNRKDTRFATTLSIVGNLALPVIATTLSKIAIPPLIWLAYPIKELIVLVASIIRYRVWRRRDLKVDNDRESIFYLSIKPEEAVEASRMIRAYADDHGYPERLSYRVSLCMEEMVAYCASVRKKSEVLTQNVIRLTDTEAVFAIIDNGRCTALDNDRTEHQIVTDNYELIKRMASSVDYQYILNMNYTVVRFKIPEVASSRRTAFLRDCRGA